MFIILHFAYLLNVSFLSKKEHKKADDNNITDRFALILNCRLLILYYAIKTPLKTKSPYDFHRPQYRRNYTRTDFYPLLYLVCFIL